MARSAIATAAKEARLVIVAEMLVKGFRPSQIAKATNVSPSQTTKDKKTVITRWQKETAETIGQQRMIVLRQNEWVLHEAVEGFVNSKEDRTKTTKKVVEGAGGKQRKEASEQVEQSDGNPAFLQIAENALRTKRELLGLDQPVTQDPLDVNVHHTGAVAQVTVSLQDTMDLVAAVAAEHDSGALPQSVSDGSILPSAIRPATNGRGEPLDSGTVSGSADEPERDA